MNFQFVTKLFVGRVTLECECFGYTPRSLNPANGESNQIFTDIQMKNSAISLKGSYAALEFFVTLGTGGQKR